MHKVIDMVCEEMEAHIDKKGRSFSKDDMKALMPYAQFAADLIAIEAYKAMTGKHEKKEHMMHEDKQENKSKSPMM